MRYDNLTFLEIRERAAAGDLLVLPTGCTEQQGPHLPVNFDTWFAEATCEAAAERAAERFGVQALVLPALPFGPTPEHRNFGSGFIDLPQALHEQVVAAVLESVVAQGFSRVVIWRGCGGHRLERVAAQFNAEHAGRARVFQPGFPFHDIWCAVGDPAVPGGHADSFSTSLALHRRPDSVRRDQIPAPQPATANQQIDWDDPQLDFARYTTSGVIGDATHASAELGAKLWEAVVQKAAEIFQDCAAEEI